MEHTQGLGRRAEVWVDGTLLVVSDGISRAGRKCGPGELTSVKFSYVSPGGFTWDQAASGNPGERRSLDRVEGWSYVGYGRIISVMPVVIDFGLLAMEDPNWSSDEGLVGRYVCIPIDRLDIVPAAAGNWPEELA